MESKIKHIQEMLSTRHRPKSKILESQISERLNKSLNTYLSQLEDSVKYINQKDELKVLKKL